MTKTTNTNNNRPFAAISTGLLNVVVNRGQYKRYGREFEDALQQELAVRNLRVS